MTARRACAAALLVAGAAAAPGLGAGIEIDKAAGEVRLPFRFVEPTHAIEVFGCSPGGPTHETVIVIPAAGGEIAAALEAVGARSETFWQVSAGQGVSQDFMLTQGDRVLVLLKWRHGEHTHEVPAEELLWRTGEDLPLLVHGFSFRAREVEHGDPPRRRVPDVIELTVGGAGRQSEVTSLLVHPTAFDFLAAYVSDLGLNPAWMDPLTARAQDREGGTLILRRVTETQLLVFRRERPHPFWGMQEVFSAQEPIAAAIDADKEAFVAIRARIAAIVDGDDAARAGELATFLAEAEVLAWQIHARYVEMYDLEWRFLGEILDARLASFLDQKRKCHDFLRQFSPRRVELARLRLEERRQGPSDALTRRLKRQEHVLLAIQERRKLAFLHEEIAFLTRRIGEEKARESTYLVALLENELEKNRIWETQAQRQAETHDLHAARLGKELDGIDEGLQEIDARLARITVELSALQVRESLAKLTEEIRWAGEDARSQDAARRAEAEKKLQALTSQRRVLQEELDRLDAARAKD